jgi:outer membrane protein TolC
MKKLAVLLLFSFCASAEVRTLTLRQVIEQAIKQNPEVALARLDQLRARDGVRIARDPFSFKAFAGSGLAWTHGFPGTIQGSAPSIVQVRSQMSLYDRPQSYQVAQANENARASEIDLLSRQDEVAFRGALLYLQAEAFARGQRTALQQVESLERMRGVIQQRVADQRELPIEGTKANVAVLKAKQRAENLAFEQENAEASLALLLGMNPEDRVRPSADERPALTNVSAEQDSIERALTSSRELKKLESNMQAKMMEIKGYEAWRWPKVELVADYALFAKYNNYEEFFRKFERHNAQVGASISVPLFAGSASRAYVSQAQADLAKLRMEVTRTRNRISDETRRTYQQMKRAETARDVARADLEVSREQLSVNLAQYEEGRLSLAKVEEARVAENEKWLAYYDAQHALEHAHLTLLRQTGSLLAALK